MATTTRSTFISTLASTLAPTITGVVRLFAAVLIGSALLGACGGAADDKLLVPPPQRRAMPALGASAGLQAVQQLAKTGDTVRDFSVFADATELVPPYAADASQTIRVWPSVAGASVSVVQWGDGESSVVPEGWNPATPDAAMSHRYAGGGTYQVEYATRVEGAWDSRIISLTLRGSAPPPAFSRAFTATAGGRTLAHGDTIAVGQSITLLPASDQAAVSVAYWGDGTNTLLPSGWRSGDVLAHSYPSKGRYAIEYATKSAGGSWDSDILEVNVADESSPPGGAFSRDFTLADEAGRPQTPPIAINTFSPLQVRPADLRAAVSVIHWGDGLSTAIPAGVRADTAPWLLAHVYTAAGTYTVEYATVSPDTGTWDSRLLSVTVSYAPPAAPPTITVTPVETSTNTGSLNWPKGLTLTSRGSNVVRPIGVAQEVTLLPPTGLSMLPPLSSRIDWGDGQTTEIAGGWRPAAPLALTTHRYATPGYYEISYWETFAEGFARLGITAVEVLDQPVPPVTTPPQRARVAPVAPSRSINFFTTDRVSIVSTDFASGVTTVREAPELSSSRSHASPDTRFVYRVRDDGNPPALSLQVLRLENDLSLTPVGPTQAIDDGTMVFSPAGHTVYLFGPTVFGDAIHAYVFDSRSGLVGEKIGSYLLAGISGGSPRSPAIDPSGEWMLVEQLGSIVVIRLDPSTGAVVSQRQVLVDSNGSGRIEMHAGGDWVAVSPTNNFLEITLARLDRSSGDFVGVSTVASPPSAAYTSYFITLGMRFTYGHLYLGAAYAYRSSFDTVTPGAPFHSVMNVSRLPFDAVTGTVTPVASTQWLLERPQYGVYFIEAMLFAPTVQSLLACQLRYEPGWPATISMTAASYTIEPGAAAEPWLARQSVLVVPSGNCQ